MEQGGVLERVNQLRKSKIESGELVVLEGVKFHFPFLSDPTFLSSPLRREIEQLDLPGITISNGLVAIRDLEIKQDIAVTTLVKDPVNKIFIIPSLGIGGRAIARDTVELYFDLDHPNVISSLRKWRSSEVAHELNHVARYQRAKDNRTLLDALISEGLATYYQENWGGKYQPTPWGNSLDHNQLKEEWQKAQDQLNSNTFEHSSWFFGKNGQHPLWTGYALGTAIVRDYFHNNPNEKMSNVVGRKSKDILSASGR